MTLVFDPTARGTPSADVWKICDFRLKSPFISETVRVLWKVNKKVTDRFVSRPMILSDLERRDAKGQHFQTDLINNARIPFDLKWPNSAG